MLEKDAVSVACVHALAPPRLCRCFSAAKLADFWRCMFGQDSHASALAHACAGVMAQQKINAEALLARFFDARTLCVHAELLGKSGKGNESVLGKLCVYLFIHAILRSAIIH